MQFVPGCYVSELKLNLGTIELDAAAQDLTLSMLSDIRLAGEHEAAYSLRVLADVPEDYTHWPAPKRRGFYKAFARALVQVRTKPPLFHREWMAQQFAVAGFASLQAYEKLLVLSKETALPWPSTVARVAAGWIWKDAAALWVEKLRKEIKRRQQRNHFLDEVHAVQAMEWLGLGHPSLAEYVLKVFASQVHKRPKAYLDSLVVKLAGELLPSPPHPAEAAIAKRILVSYQAGDGCSLAGLGKAYPSHRHVIAALVESRHLISGPDDYVFTRSQLKYYSETLAGRTGLVAVPSVRQIKDTLQLERRPAEALRAYLAEYLQPATGALPEPARSRR